MVTMVIWVAVTVALAVAVVALGFVWKLNSELAVATRRLDRYNKALFDANDEIRRLREGFEEELAHLRVALRQQQGVPAFEPQMTVREALLVHPQVEQVLASFHLGGCSHCAVEPGEKLADVCQEHGVELQTLMGTLNLLAPARNKVHGSQGEGKMSGGSHTMSHNGDDSASGDESAPQWVKLPNVALEF
jgi:hybrid cluster-associated redox disulfide protein